MAQNYAENCVFDHNSNRVSQQTIYRSVGENIFAGSGNANFSKFVENWYNEVEDYNFDSNSCSGTCGHYTQVITCNYILCITRILINIKQTCVSNCMLDNLKSLCLLMNT